MQFLQLPLSHALLEHYRVKTRRQKQAAMVGGHRMRRKGQSLEFYEYQPYMPGDDIRHVDWRASARYGGGDELLIKKFAAEEQLTLVISIDTRASMQLPQAMPKALIAAWLAEAISRITLRSGDRVVLHRLFGKGDKGIEALRGATGLPRVKEALNRLLTNEASGQVNLEILDRYLPPTAVWLIISDFYFDVEAEARKLAARMIKAQDGWRWLISMDLDSWPWEKNYMGTGSRRIEGPGISDTQRLYEITQQSFLEVEKKIESHKQQFRRLVTRQAYDHIHWQWPETQPEPGAFFQHRFGEERVLQRLFMKGKG